MPLLNDDPVLADAATNVTDLDAFVARRYNLPKSSLLASEIPSKYIDPLLESPIVNVGHEDKKPNSESVKCMSFAVAPIAMLWLAVVVMICMAAVPLLTLPLKSRSSTVIVKT
jgi:hypothetical protein